MNYPTMRNPVTNDIVTVKKGFSWPAFLITPVWCVFKGLWIQAIVFLLVAFTGIGLISWIIAGMKGNEWYFDSLLKKGYIKVE